MKQCCIPVHWSCSPWVTRYKWWLASAMISQCLISSTLLDSLPPHSLVLLVHRRLGRVQRMICQEVHGPWTPMVTLTRVQRWGRELLDGAQQTNLVGMDAPLSDHRRAATQSGRQSTTQPTDEQRCTYILFYLWKVWLDSLPITIIVPCSFAYFHSSVFNEVMLKACMSGTLLP